MKLMNFRQYLQTAQFLLLALLVNACGNTQQPFDLLQLPTVDNYCLAAQRVVTRTLVPMQLTVHEDFDAFVKSKALIEGPVIQQFNWYDTEGNIQGISCKLKNADHLNMQFGEGSAGPDGLCQDMNRAVFGLVAKNVADSAYTQVRFDQSETVSNDEQPAMTGPDWLAPYTMTYEDGGILHVATKGFVVDFSDPRYAKAPARFRGVHYCHLIAPQYLAELLAGNAQPGAVIGREVDRNIPNPITL